QVQPTQPSEMVSPESYFATEFNSISISALAEQERWRGGRWLPLIRNVQWLCSCYVRQLIVIESLNVILLHESINILLDVGDLGREPASNLVDDFLDEVDVLELLATLHDTDNNGLERVS